MQSFYWRRITHWSRFPTKREVEKENHKRLDNLGGKPETYKATDRAGENHDGKAITQAEAVNVLNRNVIAPELLTLKVRCAHDEKHEADFFRLGPK
jgi:hypothetical protein